jgi:hypothetical protein
MTGMKRIFMAALLFVIVLQAACSVRFYYVVVNSSNDPLIVEYRFKKLPGVEEMKKNGIAHPDHFFFFIEPKLKNWRIWKRTLALGEWRPKARLSETPRKAN